MPDIQLLNFACKNETEQEGTETVKFQAECPAVADDGGSVAFPAAKEQNAFIREGGKVHLVHSTRRRSCSLVNTPSPCINKALFHIQELEVKLEDWYQKDDCIDFSLSPGEVWKEMSLRVLMTGDHSQTTSRTTDMLSTNLYIEGVSLSAKENNENLDLRQITKIVLNEITELISRLEADRQEAEKALNLEKQRREALLKKIDKLSLWKLQQLPAAVQKEHEACARDINELQWHIRNKRRQLKQMQDQTAKAELLNERLLEDIDFVKKHSPLVEEKVELEHHALDELKLAQDQALTVLVKANEELKEAQLLSDDASNKAATERRVMRAELDDAESNLKQLQNDFNHSETVWDTYCSRITENEKKLKQTEEVYMKLQQEEATLKLERNNLIEKIENLKLKLNSQILENKNLRDSADKLQGKIKDSKLQFDTELSYLEKTFQGKLRELRDLQYKNKELELEIEDLSQKINDSIQIAQTALKDIQRMEASIMKNDNEAANVKESISQLMIVHKEIKFRLDELEEKTSNEEARMKKLVENMRKHVMDELKAHKIIKAKTMSDNVELRDGKIQAEKAREMLEKTLLESEGALAEMEIKVNDLRNLHRKETKKHVVLSEKLEDIVAKKKETEEKLDEKKAISKTQLNDLKKKYLEISDELQHLLKKLEKRQNETRELELSRRVMEKATATNTDAVIQLEYDFSIFHFKYQNAESIVGNLRNEVAQHKDRLREGETAYQALLKQRQKKLQENKDKLSACLRENIALAQLYTALQQNYLVAKSHLIDIYRTNVQVEDAIQDHQQLSVLQSRMHRTLVEYFKQRGLYNQAGLAKFQAASHENAQKILAVQEELSKAIQRLSAFLHSMTDGSSAEEGKENKQCVLECAKEDRKSHTVQIAV